MSLFQSTLSHQSQLLFCRCSRLNLNLQICEQKSKKVVSPQEVKREKKLKMGRIVFYSLLAGMGHLNIPQAITKRIFQLFGDQHEVYFLVNRIFAQKLENSCPKAKCLIYDHPILDAEANLDEYLISNLKDFGQTLEITDRVEFVNSITPELFEMLATSKMIYPQITKILQQLKPDCE